MADRKLAAVPVVTFERRKAPGALEASGSVRTLDVPVFERNTLTGAKLRSWGRLHPCVNGTARAGFNFWSVETRQRRNMRATSVMATGHVMAADEAGAREAATLAARRQGVELPREFWSVRE